MDERRALWKRHNPVERIRPMVLVSPQAAWRELLPATALRCQGHRARAYEWSLQQVIYHHVHLHDDMWIEPRGLVRKQVTVLVVSTPARGSIQKESPGTRSSKAKENRVEAKSSPPCWIQPVLVAAATAAVVVAAITAPVAAIAATATA